MAKKSKRHGRCSRCGHSELRNVDYQRWHQFEHIKTKWLYCWHYSKWCKHVAWNCGRGIFDPFTEGEK